MDSTIKKFQYHRFFDTLLVIGCNEKNEVVGHFIIMNGNEFGRLIVLPKYRGREVVHTLITEAIRIVRGLGFPYIWGICYDKMKKFYEKRGLREFGLPMDFPETPEDRPDGHWVVRMWLTEDPTEYERRWEEK